MTGQLGRLQRPELHRRERLGFEGIEHEACPFRTGHQRGVGGLADRGFGLEEGAEQGLTGRSIARGGQGFDGGESNVVRRTLLEELGDGWKDGGIGTAKGDERTGRGGTGVRGGLLVGDERQ